MNEKKTIFFNIAILRNNDYTCNENCGFLESEHFDVCGRCLLFKEPLRPQLDADCEVTAWESCTDCDTVCRNMKRVQEIDTN